MNLLRPVLLSTLSAGSLALMIACGGSANTQTTSGSSSQTVAITAADRQEADQLFATRCAACHGPNGEGNGPAAAALNPKPQNYHDQAWQATTTDEQIEKAIVYGGAVVGKSPAMAANPDLQSKPGVVAALREKIRKFGSN